MLDDKLKP